MKSPYFLFFLAIVVASSRATNTNLTTYWSNQLRGAPMPSSIKEYLPIADNKNSSSQFVANNPSISEDINIYKCHVPPKMMDSEQTASTSMHFLEKDLSNNVKLYPNFHLHSGKARFSPRTVVEDLPALRSTNLPLILSRFSIKSNTTATKVIRHTIELCEYAAKDENVCVTSLESMIDFVQSTLGKSSNNLDRVIQAYSTTMQDKYINPRSNLQPYRIIKVKKLSNLLRDVNSTVSCHKAEFPFAIFLCHQRLSTVPYMVTLEGIHDKTKIEAATACHMDTSEWDPRFPGLVALKATPGTPICHFLNQGSVLWVAR